MKTLIEQLRDGEIAVKNDGSKLELAKILKAAFPNDNGSSGIYPFYKKMLNGANYFRGIMGYTGTSYSVKEFIKELDNQQTTTMKTITHTQAQEIIDSACSAWKTKLAQMWAKDICFKCQITVEEDFYQEMRKACTTEQNVLFDKIFGKEGKYKVGDWVIGWFNRYCENGLFVEKAWKIARISPSGHLTPEGKDFEAFCTENYSVRLATPEEIKKATYIPDGTPCFVRDNRSSGWFLRYANGEGKFYESSRKSGHTNKWEIVHRYSDGLPEE